MRSNFTKKQSKCFDDFADSLELDSFLTNNTQMKQELELILKFMGGSENKKILDIGCGTGRYALRLAEKSKEVVGTDVSEKSIEFAKKVANRNNINNFKGIVTDYVIPYKNYFDHVLVVNVIHHIDKLDLILQKARGSLKDDGSMVLFEFNPLNPLFIPFLMLLGQTKSHLNKEYFRSNIFTLKKYLNKNGLIIMKKERYAFFPTSLYSYMPFFKEVNYLLNKIPIIRNFCAFHIIKCKKINK